MAALDFPDSPVTGDLFGSAGTIWRWDGARWASTAGASGARGLVAFAQATAQQGGITGSIVNLTGLSVSWVADPTRTYRTTLYTECSSTVAGDVPMVNIRYQGGNLNARSAAIMPAANIAERQYCQVIEAGLSGVQTRYGTMYRVIGTGTLTMVAGPDFPSFILVEDITYEAGSGGPQVGSLPRGRVAFATTATPQGGFGTSPVAPSLTLTFTPDITRIYEIFASIPVAIGSGSTVAIVTMVASAGIGTLGQNGIALPQNGGLTYAHIRWQGNFTAGAKTISFTLASNAGTVTHAAAATAPSFVTVADIGPLP